MPVTLANLKKKVGHLTLFENGGGDADALHITYPLVTQDTIDDILKTDDTKTAEERIRDAAVRLKENVIEWDLLDEDEQPVPLEVNALCAKVPFDLMVIVTQAVREDRYDPNSRRSVTR